MDTKAADLTQVELRQIIIAALREVLYTAFDQLDEQDVLLSEFVELLATQGEASYLGEEHALRESALVAYADPRIAPPVSMPLNVGDLTADTLRGYITAIIREALPQMLADPDWGLELNEEFEAKLTESLAAEVAGRAETLSADQVRELFAS